MTSKVTVSIRCRPFNAREKRQKEPQVITMKDNTVFLSGTQKRKFNFDHCFWSFDPSGPIFHSQIDVYNAIGKHVLDSSFEGFNACVFAYGQTGSGKSYSIMGTKDNPGLVPRICENLFVEIEKKLKEHDDLSFAVETSMIEIYNEKVKDLFNPSNPQNEKGLKVREHPKTGPYVEGLSFCVVKSGQEITNLLEEGNKYRTIAATQMNQTSSRAHTLFTIRLKIMTTVRGIVSITTSKINLIDLAGSERAKKTGATGQRFKEGTSINLSLISLGNVIEQLATRSLQESGKNKKARKKKVFVRYRDSTLTWLLKESLGGNSVTHMVATISPAGYNSPETLSTLRYADRAKKIQTKPKKNEDENSRIIRELKAEIEKLKSLLQNQNPSGLNSPQGGGRMESEEEKKKREEAINALRRENERLQTNLEESTALITDLQKSQEEKEKESQRLQEERRVELEKKYGLVQNIEEHRLKTPHIVNLSEDPSQSGSLIYFFIEEITTVGGNEADIKFPGLGINEQHCAIAKKNHHCTVMVIEDAIVHVNGKKVEEYVDLYHMDRIIFGNRFVFKYLNPHEIGVKKSSIAYGEEVDEHLEMLPGFGNCEEVKTQVMVEEDEEGEDEEGGEGEGKEMIGGIAVSPIKKQTPEMKTVIAKVPAVLDKNLLMQQLDFTPDNLTEEYEIAREEHLKEVAKEQFGDVGMKQNKLVRLIQHIEKKKKKKIERNNKDLFKKIHEEEEIEINKNITNSKKTLQQIQGTYKEELSKLNSVLNALLNIKKKMDHFRHTLQKIQRTEEKREMYRSQVEDEGKKDLIPKLEEYDERLQTMNKEEVRMKLDKIRQQRAELQSKVSEVFEEEIDDVKENEDEINLNEKALKKITDELRVYIKMKEAMKASKEDGDDIDDITGNTFQIDEKDLDEKIESYHDSAKKLEEKITQLMNNSFIRTKNLISCRIEEAEVKLREIEKNIEEEEKQVKEEEKTLSPIEKRKRGYSRRDPRYQLNISLSFTFNRQSLINQLLTDDSMQLLELISKINEANEIAKQLEQKVSFSLKVKYSLGEVLYFVQCRNEIKKVLSDLPKKVFYERLLQMNEYFLEWKKDSTYELPFDENPFQKAYSYFIGSKVIDISSIFGKKEHDISLNLLDDEGHMMGILNLTITDLSKDGDSSSEDIEEKIKEEESEGEGEGELMEGDSIYIIFKAVSLSGIPSKTIRDCHLKFVCGNDFVGETRHLPLSIKPVKMNEEFVLNREIYNEDDLFLDIQLFGELFKPIFASKRIAERKDIHKNSSSNVVEELNDEFLKLTKLVVTCQKAQNLKMERTFKFLKKKLNPYCKVKFREKKGKTQTQKGSSFPEWNEKLEFKMINPIRTEVIVVEIMNNEGLLKNSLIGRCFVPLSKAEELNSSKESDWFSLRHPQSGFTGKVKLSFELS